MKTSLSALTVLFFATRAGALDLEYSSVNPFSGELLEAEHLLLKGEIVPGDYNKILKTVGGDPDRLLDSLGLTLSSPGGDLQEALKIAGFVRKTYLPVYVGEATGPCASACFFIFVAGAKRRAEAGVLAVHRPYLHPKRVQQLNPSEVERLTHQAFRDARLYLLDLHVPVNIIDMMFKNASTEAYWLSRRDLEDELGHRSPWYEQFLIARCKFDPAVERKYTASGGADRLALRHVLDADSCGRRLSRPEATTFLEDELRNAVRHRKDK